MREAEPLPGRAERMARLSEILIELFRSPIPTHFFQTLAAHPSGVLPHEYLAVCLSDPEKSGYLVHTLAGLDTGAVSQRVFSLYEGLPGRAITSGQAQRLDDLAAVRDGVHDLEGVLIRAGMRPTLAVPIRRGLDVLGALLFAGRPPIAYGDEDVHVSGRLRVESLEGVGTTFTVELPLARL